jgi:hypothetical protein
MAALNENAVTKLGTGTVDMQNGDGKTSVYTVPPGKTMIPVFVIIHTPSGSLAGGTDFDIGSGADADTWKQSVNLSALTAATDYKVIADVNSHTLEVAGAEFGIKPITGATLDVTATMDLFGYLI